MGVSDQGVSVGALVSVGNAHQKRLVVDFFSCGK